MEITSSETKGRLGNRFVEIISSWILLKFNNGGRLGSSITPIPPSLCRGLRVVKKVHSRTHNSYSFGSEVLLNFHTEENSRPDLIFTAKENLQSSILFDFLGTNLLLPSFQRPEISIEYCFPFSGLNQ